MEYVTESEVVKIEQILKTFTEILDASENASQEVKDFMQPFKERLITNIVFLNMLEGLDNAS